LQLNGNVCDTALFSFNAGFIYVGTHTPGRHVYPSIFRVIR
jgi:hypothetical protein